MGGFNWQCEQVDLKSKNQIRKDVKFDTGGNHLPFVSLSLYIYWHFLIFSYKLTVSMGSH